MGSENSLLQKTKYIAETAYLNSHVVSYLQYCIFKLGLEQRNALWLVETDKKRESLQYILPYQGLCIRRLTFANKEDFSNLTVPPSFIKLRTDTRETDRMDSFNRKRVDFQCPIIPDNNSPVTILHRCFQSIIRFKYTFVTWVQD